MKDKKKSFMTRHFLAWIIVTSFILVFAIVANCVLFKVTNKVFDNLFGGDTSSGRGSGGFETDEGITDKASALANGNAVNETICEEGFFLLKNETVNGEKVLPLKTSESNKKKISVFGKNSVNLVYGGSGSGAGDTSNAKTIYDSLAAANYDYNPVLKSFYDDNGASGSGRPKSLAIEAGIPFGFATGETPRASYSASVINSFADYPEMALVVISRTCGEGNDVPTTMINTAGAASEQDHYLELDQNEQDMLQMVCESFDKVVLVVNSSQTMELGFLDAIADGDDTVNSYDYASHIAAAVWIGGPGGAGIMALGRILNGEVNPSGRTVDTYARDFTKIPAYANLTYKISDKVSSDTYFVGSSAQEEYFSDYEEGIYVGYRYFETRGYTEAEKGNAEWYQNNVIYPFGYGLSYTEFEWETQNKSELNGAALSKDSTVTVKVNVKNIGDTYAGKDVVQLYVRAPYTPGGIEKSDKVLCAFAKTTELNAGDETGEVVSLTFNAYDLASYDYNNAAGDADGFKGYKLEAGNYEFFVSKNSHEAVDSFTMTVASDIRFETSREGCKEVENLYDDADDQLGTVLSRTDWEGTWPKARTDAEKTVDASFISQVNSKASNSPLTDDSEEVKNADLTYAIKKDKTGIQLYDMIGKEYDDPAWNELLNKLTVSTMHNLRQLAAFGTDFIDYITKPKTIEPDGPLGYTQFMGGSEVYDTCLYASECVVGSTWNVSKAEDMGVAVGNESIIGDGNDPYSGWYAPGVNIHRTPFGGRNYEYYSEDSILSGKMAVGLIQGAASKGVYTYMKHFAVNEQETHRNGVCNWLTEQSLRELYLKPFEIAIMQSDGAARGVMSSFTRIGTVWAGGDYRLLTTVLRDEWGFVGCVISDFSVNQDYMDTKQMAYAGGDVNLTNMDSTWVNKSSKTDIYVLKRCAKNYLYVIAGSNAMNGLGEDVEYTTQLAPWKKTVIGIDCAVFAAIAVWGVFAVLGATKKYKASKRENDAE